MKRSSSPPASPNATWVWGARAAPAGSTRSRPVMPRWISDAGIGRGVDGDEDELADPADAGDRAPDRDRAQAAHVDLAAQVQRLAAPPDRLDAPAAQARRQPAHDRLDLGQLRHASSPSPTAYAGRRRRQARSRGARSPRPTAARRVRVPAMPLAAKAAATASSPNCPDSAPRSILRRVANACLTTASNSAGSRTGASGAARGTRLTTDDVTAGAG